MVGDRERFLKPALFVVHLTEQIEFSPEGLNLSDDRTYPFHIKLAKQLHGLWCGHPAQCYRLQHFR